MGSKCLRAWGLRSKTWGLSDLVPSLIANQIREFLKLESNKSYAHAGQWPAPQRWLAQKMVKLEQIKWTINI